MLKAVIFDFDGIIVDTEPLHYRSFQVVLEPLGFGYSWDSYVDHYMGFDDRDAFREAFRAGGRTLEHERLEELISMKARLFQEIVADGVTPYPGVVTLVKALSEKLPLALCSGALRSDIEPILKQLSLDRYFSEMVTAEEVQASKPDPASYALAVRRLSEAFPAKGVSSSSCIAIEDTPSGIASARGAGVTVLAVTNSYPIDNLTEAQCVVSSLADVSLDFLNALVTS